MTNAARGRRPPIVLGVALLIFWELLARAANIPPDLLPGPLLVLETLWTDAGLLAPALLVTLEITLLALAGAALSGAALAAILSRARWLERGLMPWAVIAQVTPIVALAPLIIIWIDNGFASLVACAWIVAFFPMLTRTLAGLNGADQNLRDLFRLHGASRRQTWQWLEAPSALPCFLSGLRLSGGLALIGAVVAEFVTGSGGAGAGLAFRILEAGARSETPRLFAALVLLSLTGIAIHAAIGVLSRHALNRWGGGGA